MKQGLQVLADPAQEVDRQAPQVAQQFEAGVAEPEHHGEVGEAQDEADLVQFA